MFDRSQPNLADGRRLEQADGTAWMGMFCLDMLAIALELSQTRPAYEAIATKFFEHFVAISHAINGFGDEIGMWDPVDGFYYDVVRVKGGPPRAPQGPLVRGLDPAVRRAWRSSRVRSNSCPTFGGGWSGTFAIARCWPATSCLLTQPGSGGRRLLALADRAKLEAILPRVLDPAQFLSDFGLRSLSRGLADEPFVYDGNRVAYEPGESASPDLRRQLQLARTDLVSGQLPDDRGAAGIPSLLRLDPDRRAAALDGPRQATLDEAAAEIARRLTRIFLRDSDRPPPRPGRRRDSSRPIPTGATTSRSMNTSTATTARAWAPATRPAGPPWSPS